MLSMQQSFTFQYLKILCIFVCTFSLYHHSLLLHPKAKASLSRVFLLFFCDFICLLWCCEKRGTTQKKMSKKRTRTTTDATSKGSKKPRILPPSPHGPFWNGTTTDAEIIAVLVNNRDEAFHYDAETSRLNLVQEVWDLGA